jgi:hypothetical protein
MSEMSRRKKARDILSKGGYKAGGHVKGHSDEAEDRMMVKKMVKKPALKLKDGGVAEGDAPKPRADRLARGGKARGKHGKPHTQVNVIVAGQHPKPVPVPVPVGANAAPGGAPMPMPPPGAGPGGPPMPPDGGPPMGLKRGGRAKGSKPEKTEPFGSQREPIKGLPDGMFKKGGRTAKKFPVPMSAGSGGGKGRLEKIKDYG